MLNEFLQYAVLISGLIGIAVCVRYDDCSRRTLFFRGIQFGIFLGLLVLKIVIAIRTRTVINIHNHVVMANISVKEEVLHYIRFQARGGDQRAYELERMIKLKG